MPRRVIMVLGLALVACLSALSARAEDTIKIAYTDPFSGPFAQVGQHLR